MWIGTFHGISYKLLRKNALEVGLENNFRILDQDDQLQIIKKVIKNLNLDEKYYPSKYCRNFINGKKDEGIRSTNLFNSGVDTKFAKIYQAYEAHLKTENALDFADLLLCSYELLKNNDELRKYYQEKFQFILVDEFQDTNEIQYQWLMCLKSSNNYFMAVGDDDQSIYGWRGAKVENMKLFLKDFSPAKMIRLEQNYRSTQVILNAANAVIANNNRRIGKTLWSAADEGKKIDYYEAFNERDEADFIAQKIKDIMTNDHIPLSNIAILYRSNAQSRVIEDALLARKLPYRIYGGFRFFDRSEVKDVLAYMRLSVSNMDNLAFERIINVPTRGIGQKTINVIHTYAADFNLSLWDATLKIIREKNLTSRSLKALMKFVKLIEDISVVKDKLSLGKFVQYILDVSGLVLMYQQSKSEKLHQKCDNLKELVNAANDFSYISEIDLHNSLLIDFLTFATLESGEAQEENTDAVQLMTLHTSKGLEFSYVFISGLEEGIFPSSRAINTDEKIAEERRLCYVGITRAMNHLTLSFSKVRHQYGNVNYQIRSRFLDEIPCNYLYNIHQKSNATKFTKSTVIGFELGECVFHQKFGMGKLVKKEGNYNSNLRYHIDFEKYGRKILLANLSKLLKL